MTVKIEEGTRKQVAVFVPKAIQKAVDSYHEFMDLEIEAGAKKFAEHHSAGKVALAHLELLLKLARWADVETGVSEVDLSSVLSGSEEANESRRQGLQDDFEENATSGE